MRNTPGVAEKQSLCERVATFAAIELQLDAIAQLRVIVDNADHVLLKARDINTTAGGSAPTNQSS